MTTSHWISYPIFDWTPLGQPYFTASCASAPCSFLSGAIDNATSLEWMKYVCLLLAYILSHYKEQQEIKMLLASVAE